MIHEVFGQIQYKYLWTKTFEIRIFGQKEVGVLNISGEEDEEIAQNQIDAFTEFELHKSRLIESTEQRCLIIIRVSLMSTEIVMEMPLMNMHHKRN